MVDILPDKVFEVVSHIIKERIGLHYPIERKPDLEKGLRAAAEELHISDPSDLINFIATNQVTPELRQLLVKYLTIGETYFFREPAALYLLFENLKSVFERRRESGRHLKIWSAGCCTGEEIYSAAILLHQQLPDIREWKLSLMGSDVNLSFLKKAKEGIYHDWSFRGVQSSIIQSFFNKISNNDYEVIDSIRKQVKFQYLNLFENAYPSPLNGTNTLDVILCRNVLMYFNEQGRKNILEKFYAALNPGGLFVVSLTELSNIPPDLFEPVIKGNTVIFRKKPIHKTASVSININQDSALQRLNDIIKNTPVVIPKIQKKLSANNLFTLTANDIQEKELNLDEILEVLSSKSLKKKYSESQIEVFYLTAITHFIKSRNLVQAESLNEQALNELKLSIPLYILHSKILSETNKETEALETLKKCLFLDNSNFVINYLIAQIYKRLNKNREATKYFETTTKLLAGKETTYQIPELENMSIRELKEIITLSMTNL